MNVTVPLLKKSVLILFFMLVAVFSVQAQYFGQNRVRYKNADFKVLQTPHFEIYYYIKNENLLKKFAQDAETWYKMHQEVFRDTFLKKNPIIL
ncbi:hypothetical protein WG904_10855 [Pedobacter sp. Du54]|uniref:hypothetical protein n=1 Tax=Pedobacter anseongensis TaxID=3133439 RepID=UPI0030AF3A00